MRITVVTLFPAMFDGFRSHGVFSGALERGAVELYVVNPRDFTEDRHHIVDDAPYGGFAGMVLKPEPVALAVEHAVGEAHAAGRPRPRVVMTSPQGSLLTHPVAERLAGEPGLVLIAGRYKGVDERVRENVVDEEISIGDYVLSGGELAAMVIIDAVARLLPGVLGDPASARSDSFFEGVLDSGYYTRPEVWRGHSVPGVLLSGHHERVRRWQRKEALRRTLAWRRDLLSAARLSDEDRLLLEELEREGR